MFRVSESFFNIFLFIVFLLLFSEGCCPVFETKFFLAH